MPEAESQQVTSSLIPELLAELLLDSAQKPGSIHLPKVIMDCLDEDARGYFRSRSLQLAIILFSHYEEKVRGKLNVASVG